MPWRSSINAEIYDRFVRERPIYSWLNRVLVRLADVSGGKRILDLACGTGATTLACLRKIGPRAKVVGIDASAEIIRVARANVLDPRVQFEVMPAASVHRLDGLFDRVVCNAAFWQFPSPEPVFAALAERTPPGARFVLNAPAERVEGELTPIHPFQVMLKKEIERELGVPFTSQPVKLDTPGLTEVAAGHGFALVRTERRDYEGIQRELIELMTIPAMILPLTTGLSSDRRRAVLERARHRCDPALKVSVPWIYFIFDRDHRA
jgi:SAM-dependent methyltransferase